MAYFNHAFTKRFLGLGTSINPGSVDPLLPETEGGLILTAGTSTTTLSQLGAGYFGFFDKNYQAISPEAALTECCPFYLASSSLLERDKLNQYIGGYLETNKSKLINPKYIQSIYKVSACAPKQAIVSVGYTPETAAGGLDPNKFQGGTVEGNCCFEFLCGETYYLRIDVKGSPALRFLNHNAYQTVSAYTGCCTGPTPTLVDSTLVMIEWAKAIVINNYIKDLILPVVFDETGVAWYAPGTTVDPISGIPGSVTPSQWWTNYVPTAHIPDACAGLRLFGAYVETKFGNCSFQITDFFEKEPVRVYASMVDYNGDPCVFEGICVYNDCLALQGMGFGEQVVRDLILAESYLQNFFHTDIRIREITQGDQILTAAGLDRNALYTRYYILHSVPRFNNPTGVFDNDRYMLEIITPAAGIVALDDLFATGWLSECVECDDYQDYTCTPCEPVPNVPVP